MTKAEWIERWEKVIAGGFLLGYHDAKTLTPSQQVEKAWKLAPEVRALLAKMFDDSQTPPKGPQK